MKRVHKILKILACLFMGFFLFGPFASNLFQDYLHFPMVIPEVLYFPILYKYYSKFGLVFKNYLNFVYIIILWGAFLVVALIWDLYDFVAICSTARSFLCVGLFYVIGKNIVVNKSFLLFLLLISIGSLAGWVVSSLLNFQAMMYTSDESVVYGNMLAIAYAFSLLLLYERNYFVLVLLFAINVVLSFTTALRRQILVSVSSIGLSITLLTIKYKKFSYLVLIGFLAIPIYFLLPQIEDYVKEANPYTYHRIFERSEQALHDDLRSSDKGRINHQYYIFTEASSLIIPHGYVSQNTTRDNTGIYNDIPTLMLSYTFGILLFYIYAICYFKKLVKVFFRFQRYNNEFYGVLFVVGTIMLFLHLIEASMFIYTYTCPMTGLTIGLLFRNDYITQKQIS